MISRRVTIATSSHRRVIGTLRPTGGLRQPVMVLRGMPGSRKRRHAGPFLLTKVSLPSVRRNLPSSPGRFPPRVQPLAWHDLCKVLFSVCSNLKGPEAADLKHVSIVPGKSARAAHFREARGSRGLQIAESGGLSEGSRLSSKLMHREDVMHSIFWLIGVIVVVVAVLNLIS